MSKRNASNFVNYQERAKKFSPGDVVAPYGMFESMSGRVTAVYPGIGMVDVEIGNQNRRFPAERLQIFDQGQADPPDTISTPGFKGVQPSPSAKRVALYWAAKDRQYKMRKNEVSPCCPKCGPEYPLSRTIYKRREGMSDRLLGCKNCLFLIKVDDIINLGGA